MSVLPLANAAQLTNWATACAPDEGYVNGLWTSILSYHFRAEISTLQYSINPEAKLNHGFSDLLVTSNNFGGANPSVKWQIILEGKASDGDNYAATIVQLVGYAQQIYGHAGWCYLIAAKGSTCMFWRYRKGNMYPVQPMRVVGGNVIINQTLDPNPTLPLAQEYSLTDVNDRQDIQIMLNYITNNPQ